MTREKQHCKEGKRRKSKVRNDKKQQNGNHGSEPGAVEASSFKGEEGEEDDNAEGAEEEAVPDENDDED